MSFIDSPLGGLLFGHTQYAMNRRREQYAEERGLLDDRFLNREAQISNNPMAAFQPVTETQGLDHEGNPMTYMTGGDMQYQGQPPGLLADAMTPGQYQLARERLGSQYFGARHAQAMDTQRLANMGAMQKHLTPGANDAIQMQQNAISNEFTGYSRYMSETKDLLPAVNGAQVANDMIKDRPIKDLNGPEQLTVLYNLMRAIKPEATSDAEYDELLSQFGLSGTWEQVSNFLDSKGKLGEDQISQIYNSLNSIARTKGAELSRINRAHSERGSASGFTPRYLKPAPQYTDVKDPRDLPENNSKRYKPGIQE